MPFRHWFICSAPSCRKHVVIVTENELPVQPGRTHGEALENGALPMPKGSTGGEGCLGVLSYCSGYQMKENRACTLHSHGTDNFMVPPPATVDPAWTDFAQRVNNAWQAFAASGYNVALRGANNYREYKAPPPVLGILQTSGGVVSINGAYYTISNSLTAGVSLHRPIPGGGTGNIRSFIFHL
jgi:hypothetical protein